MTKEEIIAAIEKMTVLELSELVKEMEKRFGVSPVAVTSAPVSATPAGTGPVIEAAEQTEFSVVLSGVGPQKIQVIKVVREITGLGLKEAKDLVEGAPKPIKEGIPKKEAEDIKAKLTAVGATVELK